MINKIAQIKHPIKLSDNKEWEKIRIFHRRYEKTQIVKKFRYIIKNFSEIRAEVHIHATSARGNIGFRETVPPLCPRGVIAMKTDPTSPIKSQLCDIRRSGSQLQSIMDGRNAAARSSIITGTLRRIGIVGNESSLSICLFDFSFRENIANEKEILCGEESIRYPCQRNFSNF